MVDTFATMHRDSLSEVPAEKFAVTRQGGAAKIFEGIQRHWSGAGFSTGVGLKLDMDDMRCVLLVPSKGQEPSVHVRQVSGHMFVLDFGSSSSANDEPEFDAGLADKVLAVMDRLGTRDEKFVGAAELESKFDRIRQDAERPFVFKF